MTISEVSPLIAANPCVAVGTDAPTRTPASAGRRRVPSRASGEPSMTIARMALHMHRALDTADRHPANAPIRGTRLHYFLAGAGAPAPPPRAVRADRSGPSRRAIDDRFELRVRAEAGDHVLHVVAHGVDADVQPLGQLRGRHALGE